MRLTTLLHRPSSTPRGGPRVHYEYANRLLRRGHDVGISFWVPTLRLYLGIRRHGVRNIARWFDFDPGLSLRPTRWPTIPRSDVGILTGWHSAAMLRRFRRKAKAFVQVAYDYEYWMTADSDTRAAMAQAFRSPDVMVATSGAVASMLRDAGREPDAVIPCGIDHQRFRCDVDPADRPPAVGIIARTAPEKRVTDAVQALASLRSRTRAFRVLAAGADRIELPGWVERIAAPDDEAMTRFYNQVSIFVLPSEYEGWGLPAAEAMACGAAVVATKSGGVEDFARHDANALLVQPRDCTALADAIDALLSDDGMRTRLAHAGSETARAMAWESSVDALERVLQNAD